MKKLSLLVALALLITVGGVYATWSYAGTNDIGDVFAEAKVTMADVELTGANGTYKIESNLVLIVNQKNGSDHTAVLDFTSNNSQPVQLKVTFTPAENAPLNIKQNAVPTEIYFGTTTPMQYKMDAQGNYSAEGTAKNIFTFANPGNDVLDNTITWTNNGDGTFTYSMDVDDLKEQISLSQTFVLDVKNEYDQFRAALAGNIVARVTDGTINH